MALGYAIGGFGPGLERGLRLADYFDRAKAAKAERERQEAERERTRKFMSEYGAMEPGIARADFALRQGAPGLADSTLGLWKASEDDRVRRLGDSMLNARGLLHPAFGDGEGSDVAREDLSQRLLANSQIFGTGPDRPVLGFDWKLDENGDVLMVPIISNRRTGTTGPQTVNASPDGSDPIVGYDVDRLRSVMANYYPDDSRITREETTAVHSIIDRELPHPDQLASPAEKEAVSRQRKAVFDLSMSVAEEAERRGLNYRPVRFVNDALRLLSQSHPLTSAMVGARNEDGEYVPPSDNEAYIASLRALTSTLLGDAPAQDMRPAQNMRPIPQEIGVPSDAVPVPPVAQSASAQTYPAPAFDQGVEMREVPPTLSFAEQFAGSAPPVVRPGLSAVSPVTRAAPPPQAAPPQGSAPEQIARRRALAASRPAYNPNAAAELMEKIWSPVPPVAQSASAQTYPAPAFDQGVEMREVPQTLSFAEQFAGSAPPVVRPGLSAVSPVTRAVPPPQAAPHQAPPQAANVRSFAEQFAGSAPPVVPLGLSAVSPVTRAAPSPQAVPPQAPPAQAAPAFDQGVEMRELPPPAIDDGFVMRELPLGPSSASPVTAPPPQDGPPQDVDVRGLNKLVGTIKKNEGLRLKPYLDSEKVPTVGYGHKIKKGENFDDGITHAEAEALFEQDLMIAMTDAKKLAGDEWSKLDRDKKHVLVEASFVLGRTKFTGFEEFWKAFKKNDIRAAALELIDSKWYREQAPTRVIQLALALDPSLAWSIPTRPIR